MKKQLDPAIAEFLTECEEQCSRVSLSLQSVEKTGPTADLLDSIYRDIHTVKGSAQLFGYKTLAELTHAMENCLDPIRKSTSAIPPAILDQLFKGLDSVEKILNGLRESSDEDYSALANLVIESLAVSEVEQNTEHGALPKVQEISIEAPVPAKLAIVSEMSPSLTKDEAGESSSSIRVPVALLDKLMTLMGEMVLVRNQVLQYANQSDNLQFQNLSQRLDVVTSEIQGEVMKTRMQPIGNVLTKFQRVIRDLARDMNKKLELVLSGTDTELDKTLLEAVKDPIMHIVRNSCDHGIESAEERKNAGKKEVGTVTIRSYHEGGQVVVEISDDGRGLNKEKLLKKAVEKNLIHPDKAALLSERDIYNFIFAAGFSTAAQVTNVSGRGVGMDVVKNNIEGIGGTVELQSQLHRGTTTRLKIPLTLAIVPAMIIRCGDERFAIPQVKLVELVRAERDQGPNRIEFLQGKPVYRLRGNLLPLIGLQTIFAGGEDSEMPEVVNIVVLSAEKQMFGLIVDEVQDTAEVVVKPLSNFLKTISIYSGATVLGDGSVALILDVNGIAQHQKLNLDRSHLDENRDDSLKASSLLDAQEFLLFQLNSTAKHAIPLNLVHRLEEFNRTQIEYSGKQPVVRYRNSVLPILSLSHYLGYSAAEVVNQSETLSVIVTQKSGRFYGIEVREILDVLNTVDAMDDSFCDRPGILGNLVTQNEVIVVVDTLHILDEFAGKNSQKPGVTAVQVVAQSNHKLKILFAEDTAFFRKHVCSVLERAGHVITTAVNGQEALTLLENSSLGTFDLVLSDVEMPKLNGLQLATAVRNNAVWAKVPMIALTTRFAPKYVEEGKAAGFDSYLEKMNPEVLLKEIQSYAGRSKTERKAS